MYVLLAFLLCRSNDLRLGAGGGGCATFVQLDMSGKPPLPPTDQQKAKRRSFQGSQEGKVADDAVAVTATATASESPFATYSKTKSKQQSRYGRILRREAPLFGLLATGTAMVVLNQFIADQVRQVPSFSCDLYWLALTSVWPAFSGYC